jgi:hypothetical protein
LTTHERALDFSNLGNWEARVEAYFADLREWLTSLNVSPETDEERKEQFHLKRQIVLNLVERVTIRRNRKLKVSIRLDLLKILGGVFGEIQNNGPYADPRRVDARSTQVQSLF